MEREESDMFNLEENDDDDTTMKYAIIGLSKQGNSKGDNNIIVKLENGKLTAEMVMWMKMTGIWWLIRIVAVHIVAVS
jgi:hypothetical protein